MRGHAGDWSDWGHRTPSWVPNDDAHATAPPVPRVMRERDLERALTESLRVADAAPTYDEESYWSTKRRQRVMRRRKAQP